MMTLAELKELDFGIKTGEKFRGTRTPTFREFLELTRRDDKMQFNFELKTTFTTKEKNSHSRAHPKQSRFLRNTDSPTACT